jgi:hypothetical protein
MNTYTIYYSSGVQWTCTAKSLRGAKMIASRSFSYACQLNGGAVTIYDQNNRATHHKVGMGGWKRVN